MEKEDREEKRSSLRDLAYIFFRRKWVITGVFLSTVIPVTIYTLSLPPIYEAKSRLLVKPGRENIYVAPVGSPEGTHPPIIVQRVAEIINSEIEIIKSRVLLGRVIEEIGITKLFPHMLPENSMAAHAKETIPAEAAVNQALHNLAAERVSNTDVIEVAFRSHDPDLSANFVDTLVNRYLERHLEVHQSGQAYSFFRNQADLLEQKLKTATRKLAEFKKKYSIVSLDQRKRLTLEKYTEVNAAIKDNDASIKGTQKKIDKLREELTEISENRYLRQDQTTDPPVISTLKQRLAQLELTKADLMDKYKPDNYKVVGVDRAIAKAREMLAAEEEEFHGTVSTGLSTTHQKLEGDLLLHQANLEELHSRKAELERQLVEYGQELQRLSRLEPELQALERAASINEQNYKLYITKFEESRVSDAMDAAKMVSVNVLEPAVPPLGPVRINTVLNIFVSMCIGGIAGLGLAFLIEYFDHTFKTPQDVKDNLNLVVLGAIEELLQKEREDVEALAVSPKPPPNYQILKGNIMTHCKDKRINMLSVSSPTPQEGCSRVALNLAAALTKDHGHRVLLVDANLRHPYLHAAFNLTSSPGFSDIILEEVNIDEALKQSVIPNLSILTAGSTPPNPMLIFESERLADLIEALKEKFDWIIFDCAPINVYPDSTVLASRLDGVVLVIQAENRRAEVAIQAKERLEQAGAKILGAVLNRRRYIIPEIIYRKL